MSILAITPLWVTFLTQSGKTPPEFLGKDTTAGLAVPIPKRGSNPFFSI
jgi:hypothetical protein